MPKPNFSKLALSYQDQISRLKGRGLVIDNDSVALHLLEKVSYFRLSGYWYPLLQDKVNHVFKPGSNFSIAFSLYCFDREFRNLVLREIEKIEVAVRAKMIYIYSHSDGPFWYQDGNLFDDPNAHTQLIEGFERDFQRSDEQFIKAFKNKYADPLPPSWMQMEIISLGALSKLYSNLKRGPNKRSVALYFGVSDTVLMSWLHSLTYIRNVCAHHTRLWNRVMSIRPLLPNSPRIQWLTNTNIQNNKSYYILSIILFLLQTVNPRNKLKNRLDDLFAKYPNVDVTAMGFPGNYKTEPLWS